MQTGLKALALLLELLANANMPENDEKERQDGERNSEAETLYQVLDARDVAGTSI